MHTAYDLKFVTEPVSDELVDHLYEQGFDVNISGYDGLDFISTTVQGNDPIEATKCIACALEKQGVHVLRLDLGLVNQSAIANLCRVSREAVSQWVKASKGVAAFPKPYASINGPLWVWGDVNEWLRRTAKPYFEDASFLSSAQNDLFNVLWKESH